MFLMSSWSVIDARGAGAILDVFNGDMLNAEDPLSELLLPSTTILLVSSDAY